MNKTKEGTRVHVWSPDEKEYWGKGTIEKVEKLYMVNDDDDEPEYKVLLSDDYPSQITLDDGRVTEGIHCWWQRIQYEICPKCKIPSDTHGMDERGYCADCQQNEITFQEINRVTS